MNGLWRKAVSAGIIGLRAPRRGEERFFGRAEAADARAWALAGGVAIHDRGRLFAAIRVIGQLPVLLDWASRHSLERALPAPRGMPPHFLIVGDLANRLVAGMDTGGQGSAPGLDVFLL